MATRQSTQALGADTMVLKYSGAIASNGFMEAYDLAAAIEGFSDYLRIIARYRFGDEFELTPSIATFRQGSFEIPFILQAIVDITGLLVGGSPDGFVTFVKLVKEVFELLKHLGGEAPKSVERKDGMVYVENNYGTINAFSGDAVNVVTNSAVGNAAASFVSQPLQASATQLEIVAQGDIVASANQEEATGFAAIEFGDVVADHKSQMHLTIKTAVLEGGTSWRFTDGRSTFHARIEDDAFLRRVSGGRESFRKGDELVVVMRSTQKRVRGKLKAEYAIERVLRHIANGAPRTLV